MTFLYLSSDSMGSGNLELGQKLMASFLKNLASSNVQIDVIGCVNSAVSLTTQKGEALDSLKKLEEKGARVASCGTCLDFFGKRENLLIGEVGTMEQSVQIMASADKIIRP